MHNYHTSKTSIRSLLALLLLFLTFFLYGCGSIHTHTTTSPTPAPTASSPEPDLANKILHVTQVSYDISSNSQKSVIEIWEKIGPDRHVQLYQKAITTNGQLTYSLSLPERKVSLTKEVNGKYTCHFVSVPTHKETLFSETQAFTSLSKVEKSIALTGFQRQKGRIIVSSVPTTSPLKGIKPLLTVPADGVDTPIHEWVIRAGPMSKWNHTSYTEIAMVDINLQGQIVANYARLLEPSGKKILEYWHGFGALYVYNASAVPASVFVLSEQQIRKCS